MKISVEPDENESTTKGSDRILESKTQLDIVDRYAALHAAETLGATVALHVGVI
jgi:hypothetical protein